MRVVVVEPPEPVVTWEDADNHLKLDGDTSQQAEVEAFIAAAIEHIDAPDGWLGRAIGAQTLEVRGSFFDGDRWRLPFPPVIEVSAVKYLDVNGVEQTLPDDFYEVRGDEIVRAYGKSWPATRRDDESVRVTYRAGYVSLPMPIRAAILLMTEDLYRNRGTVTAGTSSAIPMSATPTRLLTPYRLFG